MTNRRVDVVVLCEGMQDATFAYRFLKKRGWTSHQIRIEQGTVVRELASSTSVAGFRPN